VFALRSRQDAALRIDEDDARGEFQDDTNNDLAWARLDTLVGGAYQSHTILAYSNSRSTLAVDAAFQNRSERSRRSACRTWSSTGRSRSTTCRCGRSS
jgi:hypothetical protein